MEIFQKIMAFISAVRFKDFQNAARLLGELLVLIAPILPKPVSVIGADPELLKCCEELEAVANEFKVVGATEVGKIDPERLKNLFALLLKVLPYLLPLFLEENPTP